ncbi:MAG: hypothetical protein AB8G23_21480 [Myxococcota bacterium]
MADLEWQGEPDRPSLRRAVRHRLRQFESTIRVVAEGFLAEQSEIDLLAVGAEGELISVRIGRASDAPLVLTRALSDLSWLRARREHLLKLAPGLGLEPSAEPRALLLCPGFSAETMSAAENLPARTISCLSYRCLRVQGQLNVLLAEIGASERDAEPSSREAGGRSLSGLPEPISASRIAPEQDGSSRLTDPPSPSSFRTGLSEADLGRGRVNAFADAPSQPAAPAGPSGRQQRSA